MRKKRKISRWAAKKTHHCKFSERNVNHSCKQENNRDEIASQVINSFDMNLHLQALNCSRFDWRKKIKKIKKSLTRAKVNTKKWRNFYSKGFHSSIYRLQLGFYGLQLCVNVGENSTLFSKHNPIPWQPKPTIIKICYYFFLFLLLLLLLVGCGVVWTSFKWNIKQKLHNK